MTALFRYTRTMTESRPGDLLRIAADIGVDDAERERRQARWLLAISAALLALLPAGAVLALGGPVVWLAILLLFALLAVIGMAFGVGSLAWSAPGGRQLAPGSIA